MKRMFDLLLAVLFVMGLGMVAAQTTIALEAGRVYDELLGPRQVIPFEVYTEQTIVWFPDTMGTAAGGLGWEAIDGSKIFDALLGARQDVPFEVYSEHVITGASATMGTAAGGIRSDMPDGSKIYNELLGAKQAVPFD